MVFPTVQFALFFPVVLTLSWLLMPRPRLWKPFALIASYLFYAAASWRWCVLLALVTLGNQGISLLLGRTETQAKRKALVTLAVVLDLGLLAVYKYYGFFAQDLVDLLDKLGIGPTVPLVSLALPVGISFFTFQAISYTVDVYRRIIEPAGTLDVALYLSFFPHLVAGPIVRAREFLPQLASPRNPTDVQLGQGLALICIGLVKKVAIADILARQIVDPVFGVPNLYGGWDTLMACYAYAAQIYCDFSGYTDIAIGLALLMGFRFPQNFDRPYRSLSPQEFWRRWHMTLSRFLRDFLYIPLGGNRGKAWFVARNLMITMVLGGLWHGAAWTFVLWGAVHGTLLVVNHLCKGKVRLPPWLSWVLTFHLVVAAWVLFRSQDLGLAGSVFANFLHWGTAPTLWSVPVVGLVLLTIGGQLLPERPVDALRQKLEALRPMQLGFGLALTVVVVAATVPSQGVPPFIYFAF